MTTDYLQRFLFERHSIRGEFISLSETLQTITAQRAYPHEVKLVLGESIAAVALLSATIKYQGSLILQVQASGPINLLVAQCDQNLNVRALAKWQDDADFSKQLMGNGQLVITVSSDNTTEQYQGVVSLNSESLKNNLETYFEQSEQLPTKLWLAVNEHQAVGLLLQKIPNVHQGEQAAGEEWEYWEHLNILTDTITQDELLSLDATEILYRLFHEDDIRLFNQESVSFRCSCHKDKMIQAIETMGKAEIEDILKTRHFVDVTCQFCNNCYEFSRQEINDIFS